MIIGHCIIYVDTQKGASIITLIIIIWLAIGHQQTNAPLAQVAGIQTQVDPNHPQESFFGEPKYRDLQSMTAALGTTVYPEDKINAVPPPEMGLGSRLTITRSTTVKVIDGKTTTIYRTWQTTVSQLFKEKNVVLLGQDSASPDLSTLISYNLNIKITRVAEVETQEKEPINYKTIKQYDNTVEKGKNYIAQKGAAGEKVTTYKIKRVDGEEVSREIENSQITKQPQNEIFVIGTKIIVYGNGVASWYRRSQSMVAASNTIPRGTKVRVVAVNSGRSVVVTIDDAGIQTDAIIDLSDDAFAALAPLGAGRISVRVEKYYP